MSDTRFTTGFTADRTEWTNTTGGGRQPSGSGRAPVAAEALGRGQVSVR